MVTPMGIEAARNPLKNRHFAVLPRVSVLSFPLPSSSFYIRGAHQVPTVLAAFLLFFGVACGGKTDPEPVCPPTEEVDCSAATCQVIDTQTELGCRVSIPACAHLYDSICPPSPSFAPICEGRQLP